MPMLLGDIVRRQARVNGKKVGLVDDEVRLTYKEVNERVNRLANALVTLGLNKGDKVAVLSNNCHQYVEALFATAKVGLTIVPLNVRFRPTELARVLNDTETSCLIYHSEFDETTGTIKDHLKSVKHFIRIGTLADRQSLSLGVVLKDYEEVLQAGTPDEPDAGLSADELAMIMYTSGATGPPRGVMITQRNLISATNSQTIEMGILPEDVTLVAKPLYHASGLWPVLTHFYRGARAILLPRFIEETVLSMIESERVTVLNLVPTTLWRLIRHPKLTEYDLKSLRIIMYAGGPIRIDQLKEAIRIFGANRLYNGLGATEAGCGPITAFPVTEHALVDGGPLATKLGSVGRDAIGMEVRIVDEEGNELPPGKPGEIIAKGDHVALGYWKMPEETRNTFKNGWLYTGDMGYRDEDGYIFLIDRKKDIIISGGENVSSKEVEEVIAQHPAVEEVAVIGTPDEIWGEAVTAVVVLGSEYRDRVTAEEIIAFCKARIASYKCPKSVKFVSELPKSPVGKILKDVLREEVSLGSNAEPAG